MPQHLPYRDAALRLGTAIGKAGATLIYGGGHIGLMGIVADAALKAGAPVIGVIPAALERREVGHHGLNELVVVADMHDRKREMLARSDAVAVLAGGLGTLDEAFEAITLQQLRMIDLPIVFVDTDGFWQPLVKLIDHVVAAGFAASDTDRFYRVVKQPEDVIPACFNRDFTPKG